RVHDVGIKIHQCFAVREIERRVSVDLAPDEHVFGRKRDLLVAVSDVRAYRVHDLVFWKIDLRIQIGHAKLAATSAASGHLDDAERRARVGKEYSLAVQRM